MLSGNNKRSNKGWRGRNHRGTARLCVAATGLLVAGCGQVATVHPSATTTPAAPSIAAVTATPTGTGVPPATPPVRRGPVVIGHCVGVPILLYHYIRVVNRVRDPLGWRLSVTPPEFQAQMDWLRVAGGHPVTLAQMMSAVEGGPPLPPHPVMLTFDDGYADFATAVVPDLVANRFVGTDFVISGFIGHTSYMTASQVVEVVREGMVIGAHTETHVDLAAESSAAAWGQIEGSRTALMQLTGTKVLDFAYPYGDFDNEVVALVAKAGFRDAVTELGGDRQCYGLRYYVPRTEVVGSDTVWSFAAKARIAGPPRGWVDPGWPPTPTPTATHRR
jgi:peptidoglycan/xylan/chitin deacetylase (PgdA/CDA1 family)